MSQQQPINKTSFLQMVGLSLLVSVLASCGGPPNWVKEGSGPMNTEGGKAIYGVGSVIGVKNEPLAWEAAENRARAELGKNV